MVYKVLSYQVNHLNCWTFKIFIVSYFIFTFYLATVAYPPFLFLTFVVYVYSFPSSSFHATLVETFVAFIRFSSSKRTLMNSLCLFSSILIIISLNNFSACHYLTDVIFECGKFFIFLFRWRKVEWIIFSSVSLSYLNSFLFQMQPSAKVICGYFAESLCRF